MKKKKKTLLPFVQNIITEINQIDSHFIIVLFHLQIKKKVSCTLIDASSHILLIEIGELRMENGEGGTVLKKNKNFFLLFFRFIILGLCFLL